MLLSEIWTGGIDWNLPGNGGPDCAAFLSPQRQVLEFVIGMTVALIALLIGSNLHSKPEPNRYRSSTSQSSSKTSFSIYNNAKVILGILISLTITYLVEISYKLYTYQAIFIVNPCHCLCLVQMYILYQLYQVIQNNQELNKPLIYSFR